MGFFYKLELYSISHFSKGDSCQKKRKKIDGFRFFNWNKSCYGKNSDQTSKLLYTYISLSGTYSFFSRFNLARNPEITYPTMLKYQIGNENENGTLDVRKQDLHIFFLNDEDLRSVHVSSRQF